MTDEIHQRETTGPSSDVLEGVSRRTLLNASGVGAGGLALGATASPGAAREANDQEDPLDEIEGFRFPHLDLETLEAELDGETLEAVSYEEWQQGSTTYVGEATGHPGLFVAVSHLDNPDEDEEALDENDEQPDIVTYLCAGEAGVAVQQAAGFYRTGEFDEDGTTLTSEEGDEDTEVKLALVDGEFLGVVIPPDEEEQEPVAFVASEATGDAGLYRADLEEHTANDAPLIIRWVVLADERQRGSTCLGIDWDGVCLGIPL